MEVNPLEKGSALFWGARQCTQLLAAPRIILGIVDTIEGKGLKQQEQRSPHSNGFSSLLYIALMLWL